MSQDKEYLRLRDRSRWNQTETAERLGVSQATISRYDSGEIPVPVAIILALRTLLGETPSSAREQNGDGRRQVDEPEEALLTDVRRLREPAKSEFINAVRRLANLIPPAPGAVGEAEGVAIQQPSSIEDRLADRILGLASKLADEHLSDRRAEKAASRAAKAKKLRGRASQRPNARPTSRGRDPGERTV